MLRMSAMLMTSTLSCRKNNTARSVYQRKQAIVLYMWLDFFQQTHIRKLLLGVIPPVMFVYSTY